MDHRIYITCCLIEQLATALLTSAGKLHSLSIFDKLLEWCTSDCFFSGKKKLSILLCKMSERQDAKQNNDLFGFVAY